MGHFLNKRQRAGSPIAGVPHTFYNKVDDVLTNLEVYGGAVHRDGDQWVIAMDEAFDTNGDIVLATGRWLTGENVASSPTCYASHIWNYIGTEKAIDLHHRRLVVDTSATEVMGWEDTTHSGETPHAAFREAVWFEKRHHFQDSYSPTDTAASYQIQNEVGGDWGAGDANRICGFFWIGNHPPVSDGGTPSVWSEARIAQRGDDTGARFCNAAAFTSQKTTARGCILCHTSGGGGSRGDNYAARFESSSGSSDNVHILDDDADGAIDIQNVNNTYGMNTTKPVNASAYYVSGTKVVGSRSVDTDLSISPNSGDANTDDLITAIRDVITHHGLGAAS